MFPRLILFLGLATFTLAACKKDEFVPVKVLYAARAADSSLLRITYNSDYYYDSGIRKPVEFRSEGGYWLASHIAYGPEDYYIKVEYLDSIGPETDFRVYVVFNDTLFVDSSVTAHSLPVVELSGPVAE
jgi:hypothetical protein